jgi:hypothetical protein
MRRSVVAGLVVAGVLSTFLAPSSAGAATCRVIDARTGEHSWGAGPNLERALKRADAGDHLEISGICRGNFDMLEDVRLTGVPTPRFPVPTLDSHGHHQVLFVRDGGVITSVRIRHGRGRGIVLLGGRLELRGTTEVTENWGGGVSVVEGQLVMLDRSTIRGNVSPGGGGGVDIDYAGEMIMRDHSSVVGNVADGSGGGILVYINAVVMTGHAVVTGNRAGRNGGGIANEDGWTWFRNRASVTGNVAAGEGGGVYVYYGSGGICSRWVRLAPNVPNDTLDWDVGC